jgi:hypothetical protein
MTRLAGLPGQARPPVILGRAALDRSTIGRVQVADMTLSDSTTKNTRRRHRLTVSGDGFRTSRLGRSLAAWSGDFAKESGRP